MQEKEKIISIMANLGIDIESILRLSFSGYKQMKHAKQLYSDDVSTPEELITLYYSLHPGEVVFNNMKKAFITRYVNNENKIEGLVAAENDEEAEIAGLRKMYEYVQSDEIDEQFDIYTLKELHKRLFSETKFPEYGGEFRNTTVFDSSIETNHTDAGEIREELNKLDSTVKALRHVAPIIKSTEDPKAMLNYLDDCVKLSCKLIQIHPFLYGNGQVIRGFVNKLLIDAGLPPIYIKESERDEYFQAIRKANNDGNYDDISNFYRYKVCDSLIELDINERFSENQNDSKKRNPAVPIKSLSKIKEYERQKILRYFDYMGLDVENIIRLCFCGYKYLKSRKTLYSTDATIPETLISLYYSLNPSEITFDHMKKAFITKYVNNESIVESVHSQEEKDGFKKMYEYIHSDDVNYLFDVYTLLECHRQLYSCVPYPEFGGTLRNDQVYLPGSGANLSAWYDIKTDLEALSPEIEQLHEIGPEVKALNDPETMLEYMDRCVVLGCKLVLIHPFWDGNGRSIRGFVNKLLEDGGLPPIYIKANEKLEYQEAMEKAICLNDYESIKNFYRYKVCDSIIELDINDRVRKFNEERGIYSKPLYGDESGSSSQASSSVIKTDDDQKVKVKVDNGVIASKAKDSSETE